METSQRKWQPLIFYFYVNSLLSFTSLLQATILMCLMYMFLFACVLAKCILCLVYMYLLFTSGPCSKCISLVINCFHLLLCFFRFIHVAVLYLHVIHCFLTAAQYSMLWIHYLTILLVTDLQIACNSSSPQINLQHPHTRLLTDLCENVCGICIQLLGYKVYL